MKPLLVFAVLGSLCSCTCIPSPGECRAEGSGTVVLVFAGLPTGVTGTVHLDGPSVQMVTSASTLSVAAGLWVVSADTVVVADRFVRSVYTPTISGARMCLQGGATETVTVTWTKVPTSNALWATNQNASGQLLGFRSSLLATSATVNASVNAKGALGGDVAFDAQGNIWVPGPTTVDAAINRFAADSFEASRSVLPDVSLNIADLSCFPRLAGLAFDPAGNLYLSSPCRNAVFKIAAASLDVSATVTPSLSILVEDPQGIAFDSLGNLWVTSRADTRVFRYDKAQLASGTVTTPALQLGALASSEPGNATLMEGGWLAFDSTGALWANDFGGNRFFKWKPADLTGTGLHDVQPDVRISVPVLFVLEGFAFDDEGGLWSAGSQGSLIRLSPTQLSISTTSAAPTMPETVLTSADIGSTNNVAFYPAATGLPLYHSLP